MKTRKILSKFFIVTSVAQAAFYAYILTKKVNKKGAEQVAKNFKKKIKNKVGKI